LVMISLLSVSKNHLFLAQLIPGKMHAFFPPVLNYQFYLALIFIMFVQNQVCFSLELICLCEWLLRCVWVDKLQGLKDHFEYRHSQENTKKNRKLKKLTATEIYMELLYYLTKLEWWKNNYSKDALHKNNITTFVSTLEKEHWRSEPFENRIPER
jgi:c-di-AMP phosphodiesterase-like protein